MKKTVLAKPKNFNLWLTDKYIYIMLLIFPLFTGFWGYSEITASKIAFFATLSLIWLLSLLVLQIAKKKPKAITKPSIPEICVLAYLLLCCISALFSPDKGAVLLGAGRGDGLWGIALCCFVFFGISRFGCPRAGYIYALAVSCSLCCIVALLQLLGLNPLALFPGDLTYYDAGIKYSSAFLGTIGNTDLFSAFLCLAVPLFASYYIISKKRPFALLPALFIGAFCLVACGVSGGMVAAAVCVLIALPFIVNDGERLRRAFEIAALLCLVLCVRVSLNTALENGAVDIAFNFSKKSAVLLALAAAFIGLRFVFKNREFKAKTLPRVFAALSVFCVASGLAAVYFWQGDKGTIYEFSRLLHGEVDDSFGSSRILIWRKCAELIPGRLLLGGGPGTLALHLDVGFSTYVEQTGATLQTFVDNAHNEYLGILLNTGLFSLLAYLSAIGASLLQAVRCGKNSPIFLCLACSCLCYWVQSFFGLGLLVVSPLMWVLWGLLASKRGQRFTSSGASSAIKSL
ncbi:MAG: O-antigen ligase family protein [Oscillospiraceae bacterium]